MQEVLEAIERHLGRSIEIAQLDYYQVIGLDVYCNDIQQIRKAIQEATNRWMQSETGKYPESSQIIAKLLKQAQSILLDPEKRARYDLQLEKLRSAQTVSQAIADNHAKVTEKRSSSSVGDDKAYDAPLFPSADPMVPFSFEAAGSQSMSRGTSCALLERIRDPRARLLELEQLFPSLAEFENETRFEGTLAKPFPAQTPSSRDASNSVSLAKQIARRRRRRRIAVSLLFFFGAQAILGVAIWAYVREQNRKTAMKDKGPNRVQLGATDTDTPQLPGVSNRGASEKEMFPRTELSADRARDPQTPAMPETKLPTVPSGMVNPEVEPKPETAPRSVPMPAPPPTSEPTSPTGNPAPEMQSDANMKEGSEWKQQMATARKTLERADFETFEKEIARCVETAQSKLGRDQAARLDQLGQLYKIGTESFEEAKKKLKGTSSIRVGTTQFSIVESTTEKLVVRVSGKNQSHPWDKLPFGIAIALLDLTLDSEAPTDVATRAVFFSLAPQFQETAQKNELLKKRIAAWFEKSVGKDSIRADLPQALSDSFE